jgi:lysozyme
VNARELIKQHEGLRLKAYPDPGSGGDPWTIGWGRAHGVKRGDTCTKEQAEHWLDEDMLNASMTVERFVKVPLTNSQKDALVSLVFNIGEGAFQKSTLLRLLNMGDYIGASSQFDRWVHASGNVMPGLVKRRKQEKALFLKDSEVFAQEPEMLPLAGTILVNALPGLIGALPEIANIFKKPDVAERNVEAVTKVGAILMQATGATNMQEAVERVQADPATAKEANEALRMNRADILALIERMAKLDEDSVQAAREFSMADKPVYKKWLFVHILSMMFVILGGGAAIFVLSSSDDPTERVMALQTLLIVGFASVAGFWLGSSRSSQMKDVIK